MTEKEKKAFKIANNALYFDDSPDYKSALWEVMSILKNDYVFYEERNKLKESIKIIKGDVCTYGQKEIGQRCDCKYRNEEKTHKPFSESFSGCAELSNVCHLLNKMTDEEYKNILSR